MCSMRKSVFVLADGPKSLIARKYSETSGRHCRIQYDEPTGPVPVRRTADSILTVELN